MSKLLSLAALITVAIAQNAARVEFEVASVKPVETRGGPGDIPRNMDPSPGRFAMRNVPLRYCLEWAYELKDYEISGPDWIKYESRYDILATAPGATEADMRLMLQTLLTDRFQMKLHRETREMPVYVLVRGKGAAKLKPPTTGKQPVAEKLSFFQNQPISRLTFLLTRRLDRPVLDETGIAGTYDFTVDLSGLNNFNSTAELDDSPSIFTAIQSDLGLKLESRKAPISVLVIDSVNRVPTGN
ncbi:MAG TPA: TIGR03435 family protein [Bryobacteraceae bacterium]|nr:TIGR03435 family protein [Bryobacteraceae bacterium]